MGYFCELNLQNEAHYGIRVTMPPVKYVFECSCMMPMWRVVLQEE